MESISIDVIMSVFIQGMPIGIMIGFALLFGGWGLKQLIYFFKSLLY